MWLLAERTSWNLTEVYDPNHNSDLDEGIGFVWNFSLLSETLSSPTFWISGGITFVLCVLVGFFFRHKFIDINKAIQFTIGCSLLIAFGVGDLCYWFSVIHDPMALSFAFSVLTHFAVIVVPLGGVIWAYMNRDAQTIE